MKIFFLKLKEQKSRNGHKSVNAGLANGWSSYGTIWKPTEPSFSKIKTKSLGNYQNYG